MPWHCFFLGEPPKKTCILRGQGNPPLTTSKNSLLSKEKIDEKKYKKVPSPDLSGSTTKEKKIMCVFLYLDPSPRR